MNKGRKKDQKQKKTKSIGLVSQTKATQNTVSNPLRISRLFQDTSMSQIKWQREINYLYFLQYSN